METPAPPAPEPSEPSALARTVHTLRYRWRDIARTARDAFVRASHPDLPQREIDRVRTEIAACIEARGGEVSSRARAAALGRVYLALSAVGRRRFLLVLAEFTPSREAIVRVAHDLPAAGSGAYDAALEDLRAAIDSPANTLFAQFNSLPDGIKFLVDLRAELLAFADPALARLESDLRALLRSWFDIGFLDVRRITWDAPASLLEKLAAFEAVHAVRNWSDLKNRLDADRRCFAFFHPLMPAEPLIFIEVALVRELSDSIEALLDQSAPLGDQGAATTAIFYSISNCQKGLAGISFGNALIKRVVDLLGRDLPHLRTYATLSPIPGFRAWLEARGPESAPLLATLAKRSWHRDAEMADALREPLMRLCAHYLYEERRRGRRALDPVADFHLSNGARMERLNWLADRSPRGLRESGGMMVNYLYRFDEIDENHEAYVTEGKIAASKAIKALAG